MGQLNRMNRALARTRSFAETYRNTWQGERYERRAHLLELVISGRYAALVQAHERKESRS